MLSIKDVVVVSTGVLLAGLMVVAVWSLHSGMGDDKSPFVDVVTVQPPAPIVPLPPYVPQRPTPGAPTVQLPSGA